MIKILITLLTQLLTWILKHRSRSIRDYPDPYPTPITLIERRETLIRQCHQLTTLDQTLVDLRQHRSPILWHIYRIWHLGRHRDQLRQNMGQNYRFYQDEHHRHHQLHPQDSIPFGPFDRHTLNQLEALGFDLQLNDRSSPHSTSKAAGI